MLVSLVSGGDVRTSDALIAMYLNLAFTPGLAVIRGSTCLSRALCQLLAQLIRIGCGVSRQEVHLLSNDTRSMSMVFGTEPPRAEIGP